MSAVLKKRKSPSRRPRSLKKSLNAWLRSLLEPPHLDLPHSSIPFAQAAAMLERYSLTEFLPYRDIDEERGFVFLEDAEGPSVGVGFIVSPLLIAGKDAEDTIEGIFLRAPNDTVIQFGQLAGRAVYRRLEQWESARRVDGNPLLVRAAGHRRAYLARHAVEGSLVPGTPFQPRETYTYVLARIPFTGDVTNQEALESYYEQVADFRDTMSGALQTARMGPHLMTKFDWARLLRMLLHPHVDPRELDAEYRNDLPFPENCYRKNTRVRVKGGALQMDDGEETAAVHAIPLTVDAYPGVLRLWMMGQAVGDPMKADSRIGASYWAYTNVHIVDHEDAKDRLQVAKGWLDKQLLSESEWYKRTMAHLFDRVADTNALLAMSRGGAHRIVRAYTGMTIYSNSRRPNDDVERAMVTLKTAGLLATPERHITVPAYLSSLPLAYTPLYDTMKAGIRRAQTMSSLNAACAAIVQGDWPGNSPWRNDKAGNRLIAGGYPLLSRRGELAIFDFFNNPTNYNVFIAAMSGSGKSVFASEIIGDILARGGLVRVVDVGDSYGKQCKLFGGQIIRFDPADPMSINPFWGLRNQRVSKDDDGDTELSEAMPMLLEVVASMAYTSGNVPDISRALFERAIVEAHAEVGERMGAKDVYRVLAASKDARAKDLALQIEPYAVGRHAAWFNGEPTLVMDNRFTILELEELNQDKQLRGVVFALLINRISRDMYLSSREIPKLFLADEAWDLLGADSPPAAAKLIETAYRRIRKYNGIACVIVQQISDSDASPAAQAAWQNSAWKIIMRQDGDAIAYAKAKSKLGNDDLIYDWLGSVHSGPGNAYSEMLIYNPEFGASVYRFFLDPFSLYLYSTNAGHNKMIADELRQGGTLVDALERLAARHGRGH